MECELVSIVQLFEGFQDRKAGCCAAHWVSVNYRCAPIIRILWRRKRDSLAPNQFIPRKLFSFRFAQLAEITVERSFGAFDLQTRHSCLAFCGGGTGEISPHPSSSVICHFSLRHKSLFPAGDH